MSSLRHRRPRAHLAGLVPPGSRVLVTGGDGLVTGREGTRFYRWSQPQTRLRL